jgi:predicted dienelactone hydrolase
MRVLLVLLLACIGIDAAAQYQVGHQSRTFNDPARNNRAIACEVYYPANSPADNVPVADGLFPFLVFGHGFVMNYTAYAHITEHLVPAGYVMIYVETEGGFAPVHSDFGLDLAYVADHFFAENSDGNSIFQSHLIDRCAILGHSMGGGATWLAASTSTSVDCIAGLAPAETNPSAIAAAPNVTVPAIVFSGNSDAVTPQATNHIPIFDGTASTCRIFVNIINGSHCGFANSGSLCDLGEFGFSGLSRAEQQVIAQDLLQAFFDFHLKELGAGNDVLQSYDSTQLNTQTQIDCLSAVEVDEHQVFALFPNPCSDELFIQSNASDAIRYTIIDCSGRVILEGSSPSVGGRVAIQTTSLSAGVYALQVNRTGVLRFIKR